MRSRMAMPRTGRASEALSFEGRSLDQILLSDGDTETVVVTDEIADEFVQSALENLVHAAVLDARAYGVRLALGRSVPSIRAAEVVEIEHEVLIAAGKRARQLIAQNKQVGNQPRLHAFSINPMVGGERGNRAQDRGPLEIIERAADPLVRRQQQVILHVEDTRGVVGALEIKADTREPIRVIAQHGAIGTAVEQQ